MCRREWNRAAMVSIRALAEVDAETLTQGCRGLASSEQLDRRMERAVPLHMDMDKIIST